MRRYPCAGIGRFAPVGACALLCLALSHCAEAKRPDPQLGVTASPRVIGDGDAIPKGGGVYRVGTPYTIGGKTYVPEYNPNYRAEGTASWYGDDFHGRQTANGEIFDLNGISAAHPTMPLPSYARVTNLSNGRSLIVRVNDRGPYHGNRIIDVSTKAAHLLGFRESGTAWVRVEYVGRAPMEGSDDRLLAATLRQDEPAPAPGSIKLAATPLVPPIVGPSKPRGARYASASTSDAMPIAALPEAVANSPGGRNGTQQFLSARGLY